MHEVEESCLMDHCTYHQEDEPLPGYLACGECGHLFKTKRVLRKRFREIHREMQYSEGRKIPWISNEFVTGRLRFWWINLTVRAGKIWACPFCAHDF
jgi:hypothetical protein